MKSFKIKLKRKIFARGLLKTGKEQNVKISKYLVVNKAEGCKERSSCDKTLSIQIPSKDPDLAGGEQMAKHVGNDGQLAEIMTGTNFCSLYEVQYSVKVFVKYDAF